MSKIAFTKIMQGIEEARAYLEGTADKSLYRVHVPATAPVKKSRKGAHQSERSARIRSRLLKKNRRQ
jgi:putative transcriptional regulator